MVFWMISFCAFWCLFFQRDYIIVHVVLFLKESALAQARELAPEELRGWEVGAADPPNVGAPKVTNDRWEGQKRGCHSYIFSKTHKFNAKV